MTFSILPSKSVPHISSLRKIGDYWQVLMSGANAVESQIRFPNISQIKASISLRLSPLLLSCTAVIYRLATSKKCQLR